MSNKLRVLFTHRSRHKPYLNLINQFSIYFTQIQFTIMSHAQRLLFSLICVGKRTEMGWRTELASALLACLLFSFWPKRHEICQHKRKSKRRLFISSVFPLTLTLYDVVNSLTLFHSKNDCETLPDNEKRNWFELTEGVKWCWSWHEAHTKFRFISDDLDGAPLGWRSKVQSSST